MIELQLGPGIAPPDGAEAVSFSATPDERQEIRGLIREFGARLDREASNAGGNRKKRLAARAARFREIVEEMRR